MQLSTNNHSVFALKYHLIMVTKYRQKVIDDENVILLKDMFHSIGKSYNIESIEFNHDKDHIHILLSAHPNSNISKFINAYKSATSRIIKKKFPNIKNKLWKEMFWSRSFCLITVGDVNIDTVANYIKKQGDK